MFTAHSEAGRPADPGRDLEPGNPGGREATAPPSGTPGDAEPAATRPPPPSPRAGRCPSALPGDPVIREEPAREARERPAWGEARPWRKGSIRGQKGDLKRAQCSRRHCCGLLQGSPRTPASFDFLVRVLLTIPVISVVDTRLSLAGVSTRLHGGAGRSRERSGGCFRQRGCVRLGWAGHVPFGRREVPCRALQGH